MARILRGEIRWADLSPVRGKEQAGRRPVLIVSHDVSFVSAHLKRVACLNRRLTCHAASEISWDGIAHIYHGPMRAVHHAQECPLSDPGCERGCLDPDAEEGSGSRPPAGGAPAGPPSHREDEAR